MHRPLMELKRGGFREGKRYDHYRIFNGKSAAVPGRPPCRWALHHATIRMPETEDFNVLRFQDWKEYRDSFLADGITPVGSGTAANSIHERIKCGGPDRNTAIAEAKTIVRYMGELGLPCCALTSWRTSAGCARKPPCLCVAARWAPGLPRERFVPKDDFVITETALWENLLRFLEAVMPVAEAAGGSAGAAPG